MGVSVFFTLSGFLITNLLLDEFDRSDGIELGAFYSRRWRRLLPAGLLCLVGIVVLRFAGAFAEVQHLRADLTAATLQVYNWTELSGGSSYASLYTASAESLSPVKHYWSLAIEEQFYLLWPVVLLLLARRAKRRSTRIVWSVGVLTAIFVVAAPIVGWVFGPDAAYWATPARFGEILVGATLACVLRVRPLTSISGSARRGTALSGACLAIVVAACVLLPSDDGPAFHGWLGAFAMVSAGLIVGLQAPGPLRRALSWRPLVLIGLVSYGAYLFHWPVFVLLSARGWSLSDPLSFVTAAALTFALAAGSYRLVEQPIRTRTWTTGRAGGAAVLASAAVLVAVLVTPVPAGGFLVADQALLDAAAIHPTAVALKLGRPVVTSTTTTPPARSAPADDVQHASTVAPSMAPPTLAQVVDLPPPPNRPVRILVVGDSTAFYLGPRHGAVGGRSSGLRAGRPAVEPRFRVPDDRRRSTAWDATEFVDRSVELIDGRPSRDLIARVQPDVVVLMVTIDDVARTGCGTPAEGELSAEDARWQDRLRQSYRDATGSILMQGVPSVVWIVPPIAGRLRRR